MQVTEQKLFTKPAELVQPSAGWEPVTVLLAAEMGSKRGLSSCLVRGIGPEGVLIQTNALLEQDEDVRVALRDGRRLAGKVQLQDDGLVLLRWTKVPLWVQAYSNG